jgi:hypothetical protein
MLKPEHQAAIDKFIGSHDGKPLDKKALLKPNPVIAKALVARVTSMTPEQQQAIKAIVTPQSADALKVLLPELASLIDKGMANGAAG